MRLVKFGCLAVTDSGWVGQLYFTLACPNNEYGVERKGDSI
jgi:hypothetical protein